MSSAQAPTLGKGSGTSGALDPAGLNSNGDFISVPVLRSWPRSPPGMGWPWYLVSMGLLSKLSMWERPPFMNRKMTCLALGLKLGSLIIQGLVAAVGGATAPGVAGWSASVRARG